MARRQSHDLKSEADAPDAVALYRQILTRQPDRSVTIASVGFLGNLSRLLDSKPDQYSDLGGRQLVDRKVKELVIMGCWWPRGEDPYNFRLDYPSAQYVVANWPGPIMFTDLGKDIIAGKRLRQELPEENILRIAYTIVSGPENPDLNRRSWDHVAVLYAVRGLTDLFSARTGGRATLLDDGTSIWKPSEGGQHGYLAKAKPADEIAAMIEELMISACCKAGK